MKVGNGEVEKFCWPFMRPFLNPNHIGRGGGGTRGGAGGAAGGVGGAAGGFGAATGGGAGVVLGGSSAIRAANNS